MLALKKVPIAECQRLCHSVVDEVCGGEPPSLGDYSETWSLGEWLALRDGLSALLLKTVGDGCSDDQVLAGLSHVGPGYGEAVLSVLEARRKELRQALLQRTHLMSSAPLQDFDWQLKDLLSIGILHKLALSSDKISSLQTPLLNLSLYVREDGAFRSVAIEMGREELNTLISSLEAANKVVLQLK